MTWYNDAVFYEVLVRAMAPIDQHAAVSNTRSLALGGGTFNDLNKHLDYLQWLGVDCLWLPPFYDSPLHDGGYDIRNYREVLSEFGTLQDFQDLVANIHARGMRIITDLVVNHTSSEHDWFQQSRNDPNGPYGDYYVWSDTNTGYPDTRIIFIDTETSNWTYDPVRGQYYWHRFFAHQPDLNFDNPKVQEEIIDVARFWLDMGIDGFRLDAVPYLFEREGTNCENVKETHEFLAKLRATIDAEYPGTVLLAEANQWPADVVDYFGTAENPECHMCFNFPLMPRIFLSLAQGDTTALRQALTTLPPIPEGAVWGTFLRNHDELTLEIVNDEERAQLYAAYAPHPRMRANVGIRRRLAPLLDNDPRAIVMLTALLLSLPGAPTLYYGDEIAMGDDIFLPDRDGVRMPMPWDEVARQQQDETSVLHQVRALLARRKQLPQLRHGETRIVPADPQHPERFVFFRDNVECRFDFTAPFAFSWTVHDD